MAGIWKFKTGSDLNLRQLLRSKYIVQDSPKPWSQVPHYFRGTLLSPMLSFLLDYIGLLFVALICPD